MSDATSLIIIIITLVLFSAFFSASEAALIAINKVRLRHWVEKKKTGAHRVYGLISRMDKLIATMLVGNNLINTAIAAITTSIFTQMFGPGQGLIYATLLITFTLVIFGEFVPKVMATNHPERVAFWGRHLISILIWVLTPVTFVLTKISNGAIRMLGGNPHHRSPLVTEEEIKMMIQIGREEGFYGENERKMLERTFHFDEVEARDVMTPLADMTAVSKDITEDELEQVLLEEGHNRIPVYKEDKSNIIGILYVRDLLYLFRNNTLIRLEDLLNAPYFVTPAHKCTEVLREFQRRKIQIAIVRDPKTQKAVGLVTLEDLIEEIVGEIEEIDTKLGA